MEVRYAVEGVTDASVAEKLIRIVGGTAKRTIVAGGKSKLDPKIPGLNRVARAVPWLVLRDLDGDASCAPDLVHSLTAPDALSARMCLRIPERATEAWLLADATAFSDYFHVPLSRLPPDPDSIIRPKREIVDLCRRSTRASIRGAMVPRDTAGREVGPEFVAFIVDFVHTSWDPLRAADRSGSLRRALDRMGVLVADGSWA